MKHTLLGIDYGEKRIGLAIATTPLAEPFTIVSPDKALATIKSLIITHQVTALVVGVSEAKTAEYTRQFIQKLRRITDTPIYTQDETLSTQETQIKLQSAKKSTRTKPIDHFVAASILQEFIDTHLPLDELPETGKI